MVHLINLCTLDCVNLQKLMHLEALFLRLIMDCILYLSPDLYRQIFVAAMVVEAYCSLEKCFPSKKIFKQVHLRSIPVRAVLFSAWCVDELLLLMF